MELNDCAGGDTSSGAAGKRARLSHVRSLIGPAIREEKEIVIKWRDDDGTLRRKLVKPVTWRGRLHLVTACKELIGLDQIQEVGQ